MPEVEKFSTHKQYGGSDNSSVGLADYTEQRISGIMGVSTEELKYSLFPYNCSEEGKSIIQGLSNISIRILIRLKYDGLQLVNGDISGLSDGIIQPIEHFIKSPGYQGALEIFPIGILGRSFCFQEVVELSSIGLGAILRIREFHEFSQLSSIVDDWKILASWTQEKLNSIKLYIKRDCISNEKILILWRNKYL